METFPKAPAPRVGWLLALVIEHLSPVTQRNLSGALRGQQAPVWAADHDRWRRGLVRVLPVKGVSRRPGPGQQPIQKEDREESGAAGCPPQWQEGKETELSKSLCPRARSGHHCGLQDGPPRLQRKAGHY